MNQVLEELDLQIFQLAENPVFVIDVKPLDPAQSEQGMQECREAGRTICSIVRHTSTIDVSVCNL